MAKETKDPSARLEDLVGFDAAKPMKTSDVLEEALKEINKERAEKAKDKALGLMRQAFELREKMVQAEREFEKQRKKFNKELGKIVGKIQGGGQGQKQEEEPEAEESSEEEAEE